MSQRECNCKDCQAARALLAAHRSDVLNERAEMYKQYEELLRRLHFPEQSGHVDMKL